MRKADDRRTTQYFEMLGNQGIYHDGWMASAVRGVPWLSENAPGDLLNMPWELYNVEKDFSQSNDLAKEDPEKLQELSQALFMPKRLATRFFRWTTARPHG